MGRKSKKDNVLRNIDIIKEMKKNGSTDLQIAKHLGVCPATWYKILKESPELQQAIDDGKKELETRLVGELARKAFAHTLTTTKTFEKNGEITTEITTKEIDGDLGSIIFLLKNISNDWVNDPQMLKLKQEELQLKKQIAENNQW